MTPLAHSRPVSTWSRSSPADERWLIVSTPEWRWLVSSRVMNSGGGTPEWLDADGAPRAEVLGPIVKQGPHRITRRALVSGTSCYLKCDRNRSLAERLRSCLRSCAAEREFRRLRLLEEAGLPVVSPLAVGRSVRWQSRGSWLLTAEAAGRPLDELAPPERRPDRDSLSRPQRMQMAQALVRLLVRLHAAGFYHRDLHVGNLLWVGAESNDGAPRLMLVDVAAVESCMGQLPLARRWQNLVQLRHSFCLAASRAEQLRFARCYLREALLMSGTRDRNRYRRTIRELASLSLKYSETAWAKADRKWARGNSRMVLVRRSKREVRGLARLGRAWLEQLADADCRPAAPGPVGWRWLELSDARQVWERGHALLRRGVRVAEPLVMVQPLDRETGWVAFEAPTTATEACPSPAENERLVEQMVASGSAVPAMWQAAYGERQNGQPALSPQGLAWLVGASVREAPSSSPARAA